MAGIADDANGFDVFYGDNVDFSGGFPPSAKVLSNGQLLIGSTALPHIQVGTLTSPLGTLNIAYSPPNITIDLAGGSLAIDSIGVDTTTGGGTNPVVPDGTGKVTMTGGQYASGTFGTRVITINSAAPNSLTAEVQISSVNATSLITLNGVCHFDSADFTVDANGFVSAAGTGFVKTLTGSSGGARPPTANNINILGGTVASGTTPVAVAGAASTLTVNIQRSQALSAADSTKVGLSNFNSGQFTVDSNGFVSSIGGGLSWVDVTGTSQTISASTGYLSDNAGTVAFTLPASSTIGDVFRIVGIRGAWTLAQAANQQIKFGSAATTVGVGGSLASTNAGDCIELVATNTSASSIWRVCSSIGNITVV